MIQLRDYQLKTNREVWRAFNDGAQSVLLQAPTGSGKTICGAHLIAMRREHAREKVLVLAHRREIVMQTASKLMDAGIETGIIMANQAPMEWADVQVGSIDTLWARRKYQGFPEAQFVVCDEAHRLGGDRWTKVYEHYKSQGAKMMGMTATPMRNDGVGLKKYFDVMVRCPDMPELIEMGYLCPVTYRVGIVPDVKGVKLTAGDYNRAQLEAVMDAGTLIGDVVENWLKFAGDRRTMVFAAGVAHSIHLMNQFKEAGINAVHIDGETDKPIRDRVFQQINSGEVQVICNAMVYTEGTDIPCIDCIVDAAPSKSLIKYLQAGGRGMRTFPGKSSLLFMDHAGNVYRHGRLELPRDWELTEGKEQVEKLAEQRKKTEKVQITCSSCGFMFNGVNCPRCGTPLVLQGEAKDFLPAVLVEMTQYEYEHALASKRKKAAEPTPQQFYSGFLWIAQERGHAKGWASYRYREKFGTWPNGLRQEPAMPVAAVWNFDKHCRIRYAKSKQKAASPVGAGGEA
jgi:DNA repair protein RadD